MRGIWLRVAGVVGAITLFVSVLATPASAAPGGMSRFTVAIGGLSVDSRTNWVRLATYSFTANGQVTESHFHWSQRKRVTRSGTGTEYYLSTANTTSTDRRDTIWHWRTALADGRGEYCYTGNSHVKPMLQIIDSDGGFHGWVAVESSLNQTVPDQGTSADDIGVFEISEFS